MKKSRAWRGLKNEREQLQLQEFPVSSYESGYHYTNTVHDDVQDPGVLMDTHVLSAEVNKQIGSMYSDSKGKLVSQSVAFVCF